MKLYEGGEIYELPKGQAPEEVGLNPAELQKYLSRYQTEDPEITVEVVIQNGTLALDIAGQPVLLELFPPDGGGKLHFKFNPQLAIGFNESINDTIESCTSYALAGTTLTRPKIGD